MKNKKALVIIFFACFIFGSWCHLKSQAANQEDAKQEEEEKYLRTAKFGSYKQQAGRRTEAWVVDLDDGKIKRYGFFKVTNRTRPHQLPDSYKYGIAAYELDKLLDLNLVLPIVERERKGIKGSLQLYLTGAVKEEDRRIRKTEPPDPESFENTLEEINVFEILTFEQEDLGDILIEMKKDWKIWRVDFSTAFVPSPELNPEREIKRCSKKLYQNLLKLDDKVVKSNLKHYLNDEEISTLLKRKNIIIEKIKKLIDEKGEESVLFS